MTENSSRLQRQMDFIKEIDKEKLIGRQTYISDASRKENDAEHAWHLALMAILLQEYANEEIDVLKTVTMVLMHDIVEIDAGDTYAYASADNSPLRRLSVSGRKKRRSEFMVCCHRNRRRNIISCGWSLKRERRRRQSSPGHWTICSR